MRAPSLRSAFLALGLCAAAFSSSCSGGEEPAPEARVEPIAPLRDWSSVADRRVGEAVAADDTKPATEKAPAPKKANQRAQGPSENTALKSATEPFATKAEARGVRALYGLLPKDALVVLAAPRVAEIPGLFRQSELGRMFERGEAGGLLAQRGIDVDAIPAVLLAQAPELATLLALGSDLDGGLAVAVSGLDAETLGAAATGLPWVVTAVYDAGTGTGARAEADRLAGALAPVFARLAEQRGLELLEKAAPAWGCEVGNDHFLVDLERRGDTFVLRLGGRAAVVRELASARKRTEQNSFLAVRVSASAASPATIGAPLAARSGFEFHLQLTPLWDALRENADRTDQRVLARTGLPQILGASMILGRTEHGLAEAMTLHSPSGVDLLTHLFTGQPLDRSLAACVPARLVNATICTFDGTRILPDLCLMLPPEAQSGLVRALAELRTRHGVDLERDVLANFGPTLAFASEPFEVDPTRTTPPALFAAIALADPARAQRTLNAILVAAGRSADVRDSLVDGARISALDFTQGNVKGTLHWCLQDGVLMASTVLDDLRAGLRGLRGKGEAHTGLARALERAGEDAFCAGYVAGDATTSEGFSLGRRSAAGLEFTTTDGHAMGSTAVAAFVSGMVASVTLPKLMGLRIEANERAAGASLRYMMSAQAMAADQVLVDTDHDGRGEYLLLPELCGAAALRGKSEPLADSFFDLNPEWVAPGVGMRNGYLYRVDLPVKGDQETAAQTSSPENVDGDEAEVRFTAYAWPRDLGTGRYVFAIDQEGELFRAENVVPNGGTGGKSPGTDLAPYSSEHAPAWNAFRASSSGAAEYARRTGRDGRVWTRVETN